MREGIETWRGVVSRVGRGSRVGVAVGVEVWGWFGLAWLLDRKPGVCPGETFRCAVPIALVVGGRAIRLVSGV